MSDLLKYLCRSFVALMLDAAVGVAIIVGTLLSFDDVMLGASITGMLAGIPIIFAQTLKFGRTKQKTIKYTKPVMPSFVKYVLQNP